MAKVSKTSKRRHKMRAYQWEDWSDEQLLDTRFCDFDLKITGTWLEREVETLYSNLANRGLRFKPHVWLSEEWFCPDGVPGFAIPFYLAHPRLMKLERKQMLEVEGGNRPWCLKLLRHETGHAIQNAFRLHRRKRWREVFGKSSVPYPDSYRPKPASKDYVLHLYHWYAQSHPVEDFAETFALWLKPGRKWVQRYAEWPALKKLEYVDELMESLADEVPPVRNRKRVDSLPRLKMTLREYYEKKRAHYGRGFPDIYDRDLVRLFSSDPKDRDREKASAFLRRNRREIRSHVAMWTGEYAFTLDQVFSHMMGRCRELGLRVAGEEEQIRLDFAILLTVRTMQYLYTMRERVPL